MKPEDKIWAETVIRHLIVGTKIDAIRFRNDAFTILFDTQTAHVMAGEIYLHLDSQWQTFDSQPAEFPQNTAEKFAVSHEEQLLLLYRLREHKITHAELGQSEADLSISFDNGNILFISGHDQLYESWELGTAIADTENSFIVVATPGGNVSTWCPASFTLATQS